MQPNIEQFAEQQYINSIQPFKQCPINEVLKVVRLDSKKTKIGLSNYITTQKNNSDTYYRYWIPDGVKTKILETPIPCYMLNKGLKKFTNNDGKTVEYYKVSFIE